MSLSGSNAAVESSLGGNQTMLTPLFANEPLGDFRQISGSPTIDAGAFDPLLGATSFDGQPRVGGYAPDIGAAGGAAAAFAGSASAAPSRGGDGRAPTPSASAAGCAGAR